MPSNNNNDNNDRVNVDGNDIKEVKYKGDNVLWDKGDNVLWGYDKGMGGMVKSLATILDNEEDTDDQINGGNKRNHR